ncbi:diguanylate cyclase domain-containing protein [Actinoplanes sp. GCM10030250]|uniref:diguanylate cyclase domain-containing protein n=1 Tax=Actinoplanes sp. GCM10030250 TaxID=3273376 RepID=UPI00361AF672
MILYVGAMFLVTHAFYRWGLSMASPIVMTGLLALFLAGSHERWQRLLGGGHMHNRIVLRLAVANVGAAVMMTYAGWSFMVPAWAVLIASVHIGWSGARSRLAAGAITAVVTLAAQAAVHAGLAASIIPLKYSDGAAIWGLLLAVTALNNVGVSAASGEEATAALHQAEARFRALVEKSSDVVAVLDANAHITLISPAIRHVAGWEPDDVLGLDRMVFVHPDDVPAARAALDEVIAGGDGAEVRFESRSRRRDGAWRWYETTMRNLLADPAVGGIVCNERDVTERRLLHDELAHAAAHDGLTGLPNRTEMSRRLAAALPDARPGHLVALLYIDLDGFKGVNDAYGHATGDALLVAAAERLRGGLRAEDELCRLGGDEFAAILSGVPSVRAVDDLVAELSGAMRLPFVLSGRTVQVGASIGSATADSAAADATVLVERADTAMYAVKHGTTVSR